MVVTHKGREDVFQVDIPFDYLTWHTHPTICYIKNMCYIKWPSGMDMGSIFKAYKRGQIGHFLFSREGSYLIQVSPPAMRLIKLLTNNCIEIISELIKFYFQDLEQYRGIKYDDERIKCLNETNNPNCFTYDTQQTYISINKILNEINTINFNNLFEYTGDNRTIQNLVIKSRECINNVFNAQNYTSILNILNSSIFICNFVDKRYIKSGIKHNIKFLAAPEKSFCSINN